MSSSRRAQQAPSGEGAERVLAIRKLGGGHQYEIQWRGQLETTWEPASRVRKEIPQLVHEFEQRQQQPQPAEGATDSDEPMLEAVVAQPGSGAAADSAALQRQVAELALLVKQQAQRAEEQQQHARQQQSLIEQLRASPAHSLQLSAHPSPQRSPQQEPHRIAAAAAAAVVPAAESVSRFARKEPRAQDLQEYHGAAGAKLDDWLDELGSAVELYELTEREAVAFATSRLRDAARLWWNALGSEGKRAIVGVALLAAALRARFQPITAAHTARVQLDKLQQGSRSINDYIADFQRLRTRLPNMAEDDALHAFKRGLRTDIASELRKQRVATLEDAISLASHVASEAAPAAGRSSLHQMDINDGDGSQPPKEIWQALLNAMQAQNGGNSIGAKTQTHRGYTQEREQSGGAGRGGRGGRGGRVGRFAPRGPPPVPGVPEQVVQRRWDAKQCLRCGEGGHNSHACPNAISASGN
jgi:hypothetical protein